MIVNEISLVIQNIISFLENQVTVDQKKRQQQKMREKTYRIKTNNQELLIRKQNRKVVLRYGLQKS